MQAVGLYQYLPIKDKRALLDLEMDVPTAGDHDLLVSVKAVSVNPVDTKVRAPKAQTEETPRVLGWDAAGIVIEVGEKVTAYKPGDEVYYAGDITRPGSNSELHLVDERIVGRKPDSLGFAEAAALPLTGITAWEALFERLNISNRGDDKGKSILIIGAAGGVGSIAIQLAKKLAGLTVIASASRPETREWCQKMGADQTVNHKHDLAKGLNRIGYHMVNYILCLNNTDQHWPAMTAAIAPQGMICSIVETQGLLDMDGLKSKSSGFVWEFMFTRSMYQTSDMNKPQLLLNEISHLVDQQQLVTTCTDIVKPINASNLRKVHARIERNNTIGKIVLADWG